MNTERQESRQLNHHGAPYHPACPACGGVVATDGNRCSSCGFTGADTMEMFSDVPPPLLPLFDAAGIWTDPEVARIESGRQKLNHRFPQFHWHVYTVMLPPEQSLPVFGFWLLNACPYHDNETEEERAWSVMLLIDARSGMSAVVPGYSAEAWLHDAGLKNALASMTKLWRTGRTADAVVHFFRSSAALLDDSWSGRGFLRRKSPNS